MILPGVVASRPSGGVSSYTAPAVHFDGTAILTNNNLVTTNTNILSVAGWFKDIDTSGGPAAIWVSDPDNSYDAFSAVRDAGMAGEQELNAIEVGFLSVTNPAIHMAGSWHCVVASAEANNASPQPASIFIDGVDQSAGIQYDPNPVVFAMNALKFVFGGDPTASNTIGDFADWRIDNRSWLVGGTIPPTTLAYFRDPDTGKPVDPAVATAALGNPMIMFSGDASTFGGNQGTGGAFTLTGSLTNASTSPSDDYIAKAVHLNGASVKLAIAALSATDGPNTLNVFWVKFAAVQTSGNATVWTVDPSGAYVGYCAYSVAGDDLYIAGPNATGATGRTTAAIPSVWTCVMCSLVNGVSRQLYLGDTSSDTAGSNGSAGNNAYNGLAFNFGDDDFGDGVICDIADYRLWTDIAPDISVEAIRRLFIDANGKPVDPAVAAVALGDPTISFSGDATTFGQPNLGTGGAFTLTGSLTNASTSPSD